MKFDLFVSHANEDKEAIAVPLANHLSALGYKIWFDEFELKPGDSLRESIDRGLSNSKNGLLILSPAFFSKKWPAYELNSLTAIEMITSRISIIPIWHNVTKETVLSYSPSLADKVAIVSTLPLTTICQKIASTIGEPTGEPKLLKEAGKNWDCKSCPRCGQFGEVYELYGSDGDEGAWFECPHCGYFEGLY